MRRCQGKDLVDLADLAPLFQAQLWGSCGMTSYGGEEVVSECKMKSNKETEVFILGASCLGALAGLPCTDRMLQPGHPDRMLQVSSGSEWQSWQWDPPAVSADWRYDDSVTAVDRSRGAAMHIYKFLAQKKCVWNFMMIGKVL